MTSAESKYVKKCTLNFIITSNPQTFTINQALPGRIANAKLKYWNFYSGYVPAVIDFGDAVHNENYYGFGYKTTGLPISYGLKYEAEDGIPMKFKSDTLPPNLTISVWVPDASGNFYLLPSTNFPAFGVSGFKGASLCITFDLIPE